MSNSVEATILIRAGRKVITTITESQLIDILTIYSDEPLIDRPFFRNATQKSSLTIKEIRSECDRLNIPWQLFLLQSDRLTATIKAINDRRTAKFGNRLIISRDGNGHGISLRIADRIIALQEYAKTHLSTENEFCGSLKETKQSDMTPHLIQYFEIDPNRLHGKSKTSTLDYLIEKFEAKNIRIARGVLSNKIMPAAKEITVTYRKSSGFIVHDNQVPYVFLPSEVSEITETAGRQILTLLSLIALLGRGEHNITINGTLETQYSSNKNLREAFEVASEILLPRNISDGLKGENIDTRKRDELAAEYMLTPSALVVTLRHRDVLESDEIMQELLESIPRAGARPSFVSNPKLESSVKKFCGTTTASEIMRDIRNGRLQSIPAQYLLFGHVDKRHFAKLKAGLGI